MAFDGIVLRALTHELKQKLIGGRVDKIYQPLPRDLLLLIRSQGRNYRLLISANPTYPRMYLTERYKGQNPTEPPMFCMLLRKHLEGGRITGLEQVGNERILHFYIENRDELGDLTEKQLIVEIMGRHSNVILIDPPTKRILDGVVHVNFGTSRHREVLPGRTYVEPPEQDKISPLKETKSGYLEKRQSSALSLDKFLVQAYSGISPLIGKELAYRVSQITDDREIPSAHTEEIGPILLPNENIRETDHRTDGTDREHLPAALQSASETEWRIFEELFQPLRQDLYHPTLVLEQDDKPKAFSAVKLTHVQGISQEWDSISKCMETFYEEKSWRDTLRQKVGDIERVLHSELDKNRNKLIKFEESIRHASESETYRIWGELLTASLYQLQKGHIAAKVINFYEEAMPEIEIPLDPQLSPQENAQAYFKKYNKVKKSVPILQDQIQQTNDQIDYLESVLQLIRTANLSDLEGIREELEQEQILKPSGKANSMRKKKQEIRPERYVSSDGIDIYVGKNNKQNDYITMKFAHSADTWLHTKDIPGSHVIIRAKEVPETTLREAAVLAATYSKASESGQVPVDYTLIKHVWKPNGAKPGMVLYEGQKTLYVTPDPILADRLRAK